MLAANAVTLLLVGKFILIGAAIAAVAAAFALIYDDIQAFIAGQDSMIGEIAKKWPMFGDIVRTWVHYLTMLKDIAVAVFGLLADLIMDPANAWDNFTAAMGAAFDKFASSSPLMIETVGAIKAAFADMGQSVGNCSRGWQRACAVTRNMSQPMYEAADPLSPE